MLTDRQERFCKEYIIDCNATQAGDPCRVQSKDGLPDRGRQPQETSDIRPHR